MQALLEQSNRYLANLGSTYHRSILREINWDNRLIGILGARGVGKTTLLLQRMQELKLPANKAVYLVLDDIYFTLNRLQDFTRSFYDAGGRHLFIDEVHRYGFGTWAREIKAIYDLYPDLSIVFTGSSVLKIVKEQADLSRRLRTYHMPGLSLREYLNITHQKEVAKRELKDILVNHELISRKIVAALGFSPVEQIKDYFISGYYPFFQEAGDGYLNRLNETVKIVLENDLPYATERKVRDIMKISMLLFAVASSAPFIPNVLKLSTRLEISRVALLKYFQLLEQAQLLKTLKKQGKGISSLQKPDKVYLDNPNLIYALAPNQVNVGALRETFVLNQLTYLTRTAPGLLPPEIRLPKSGDIYYQSTEQDYLFEIGGPNKHFKQIGTADNHFIIADGIAHGAGRRIPLWLFGYLY
ncbi:MAG: AAA family ATPase [Bacteroidota bacterium]